MRITEFKQLIFQGHGRAYSFLRECKTKEKYKKAILFCCTHNCSFDYQCNRSKALLLYDLIKLYEDTSVFETALYNSFINKASLQGSDRFLFEYELELIKLIADSGNSRASEVLEEKYKQLLNLILSKRRRKYNAFTSDFEIIACNKIKKSVDDLVTVRNDINKLQMVNKNYDLKWFDVLRFEIIDYWGEEIAKQYFHDILNVQESFTIPATLNDELCDDILDKVLLPLYEMNPLDEFIVRKRADEFFLTKLAECIVTSKDDAYKASRLLCYERLEFYFDYEQLLDWSKSQNEDLAFVAKLMLNSYKSDANCKRALKLLGYADKKSDALLVLLHNYSSDYKNIIISALNELTIDLNDSSGWHEVVLNICDNIDEMPNEFLNWIYEKTACSICRETAIEELIKRGAVSTKMIRECQHDAFEDIRKLVE